MGNKKDEYRVRRVIRNKDRSPVVMPKKIQRNDPCHCGSKKKYKSCCSPRDEAEFAITTEQREAAIAKAKEKETSITDDKKENVKWTPTDV